MTHGHDLDHVQVDGLARPADGEHGLHAHVGHLRDRIKEAKSTFFANENWLVCNRGKMTEIGLRT
jgi:hypothetical protein